MVIKLDKRKLGEELKANGIQIRAMVYEYDDTGETEYDMGHGEFSIPVSVAVTEVDAALLLSPEKLRAILDNNSYGSITGGDLNYNEDELAKELLRGAYSLNKSYTVTFYITRKGKSNNMATPSTTKPTTDKTSALKVNAMDAAKRTAVNKMLKAMQKPIAGLLKSQGRAELSKMVDTPEGKAMLAGVLGILQMMLPQLQTDEAALIGEELRTQSLSYVTDHIGDLLDPLLEAFGEAAASLPKILP